MAMTLFPQIKAKFHQAGVPYSGGKVYFYEPGTSNLKDTYTDQAGGTANANPVILDSEGEADIWLNGFYKVNIKTSDDVQVTGYPIDNVSSGSAATSSSVTEWTSPGDTPTYISTTQFSVLGDQSTVYQAYRRVRVTVGASTYYGVITVVAYVTVTTVTVTLDTGSLGASLSVVDVGILTATNPAIPESTRKVADATAAGHAVNAGQVQDGVLVNIADTGAADVYVGTLAPAITAYTTRMRFALVIANANLTTTPTVNLNSLGAKTIKRPGGSALNIGDLPTGHIADFWYDGTDVILLNPFSLKSAFMAHRNGSGHSGIVTATWTKMVFTDKEYDINNDFDTSASEFTAPVAGGFNLCSMVTFTAISDGTQTRIAVYKNDVIYKEGSYFAASASMGGGGIISIPVNAAKDDTFKIYVRHNEGANESIQGGVELTWFAAYKID